MAKSGVVLSDDELSHLETQVQQFDYIQFSWSDIHGIQRGVTVPGKQAHHFLRKGFPGVGGTIAFGTQTEPIKKIFFAIEAEHGGDTCQYIPARSYLYPLPWVHKTKTTAKLICEALWEDGSAVNSMPRYIARAQTEKLASMGLKFYSAFESEFTVLHADTMEPLSKGIEYMSNQCLELNADWLYDIAGYLQEFGMDVRLIHPEFGFGQWEMNFMPKFGLDTLDDMYVFKQAIKMIAMKHGKVVTFMPSLLKDSAHSGFHLNLSLWTEDGKNAFYDPSKPDNLSDIARYWLGGMLKHLRGMTALNCPTVNCYRRLHSMGVPSQPDWAIDCRFQAVRVLNRSQDSTRFEHRLPSSACNTYLATAAVIAAGIDGIENKIEPPPAGARPDAEKLPSTLEDALTAMQEDDVIARAVGKEFMNWFCMIKRDIEIKKFSGHDMKKFIAEEVEAERQQYLDSV